MRPQEEEGLPPHLLSSLISATPWNEQVQSLNHLTDLALSPSPQTLRQLRSLTPYFQSAIDNPRSTLVRSVCDTISTLAAALRAPFVEAVGNAIIPNLLNRSAVTKAVIRESCVNAARSMFDYGVEGVHFSTARALAEAVSDRRAAAPRRATAALFLGMILVDNCRQGVQYIIDVVIAAIIAGCSDPDESVRATSRENWRRLQALDPAIAAEVLASLPSQTVQLINRERDDFGDPFHADHTPRTRMLGSANVHLRTASRVGLRPGRVGVDEQRTQRKARPHLRPPRRSVLPGAFTNLQPASPDSSPPKRNEMHPARRVFSPMAVDTPAPVCTPARVNMPAALATPTLADIASMNDLSTPKPEDSLHEPRNIASTSSDAATEQSAVSSVSYSTGSRSGTSDSQNPLADNASHTTETSGSSVARSEKCVSAVSSSSVSTTPSAHEAAFQKIAGSGAARGTNEDSSTETPLRSLHSDADSVSAHASAPDPNKARLSFILGANQTPRVYTPLPPISKMLEPEEPMQTFTPMDICTPMKNEAPDGALSGVVMKPLARSLEDRLDEAAQRDLKEGDDQPNVCDIAEGNGEAAVDEEIAPAEADASPEQDVKDEEHSPENDDTSDTQNSAHFEKGEENANLELETAGQSPDEQNPDERAEEPAEKEVSTSPDLPSTPDSLEDDLLKQVASLTSSAEKEGGATNEDVSENSSWDTLVQDLENTLGLKAPLIDGPPAPEQKKDSVEPPAEKIESSGQVESVKPGEGKENVLPVSPQTQLEDLKSLPEVNTSTKVEDKEKGKMEMTKAERQAALARRPPRRSVNPGAIKPMPVPVEKKSVRPSVAPPVPPRTERRKPPVPSFSRKPPVPRKSHSGSNTGSNSPTAQSPSTAQKPPTVAPKPPRTAQKPLAAAQKPPTIARKLPANRPRASTAMMRPSTSAPPGPSVRRVSTPPMRPGASTAANTSTKASTTQRPAAPKPVSALPPKPPKAATRKQTPRQVAVIDAYRACARAKKGDWSTKWKELQNLETRIKGLQGDTLPPRLCDDATALLGEYVQETHHKVQLSALDALFFLLLCTEKPPQITALNRALDKRPEILRRVLGLLKDGREDVRLACGRVMQSFEVLFGPEVAVALLMKAVSGTEGKVAEMGCVHMLKTFERARQGDGFVWKAGVLEALVALLAGLKQNRRVEVRQGASKVFDAVKECLPDRAFEIVCKKVGINT